MMVEARQPGIPVPTVRRLPAYLNLLRRLHAAGESVVSGTTIAQELGLESIQVRKDLAATGTAGRAGIGFEIPALIQAIEHVLGWDNVQDAFLVGAGALGQALLGYKGFGRYGLNIVAAFDIDPAIVGRTVRGRPVLAMNRLAEMAQRMHVQMGILTVPEAAAQAAADQLTAGGVTAIWNFTSVALKVPAGVIVQNAELASELAVLSIALADARRNQLRSPESAHPHSGGGQNRSSSSPAL